MLAMTVPTWTFLKTGLALPSSSDVATLMKRTTSCMMVMAKRIIITLP